MLDKTTPGNLSNIVAELFDKFAGDDEKIERHLKRAADSSPDIAQELMDLGIQQVIRNQYTARRAGYTPVEAEQDDAKRSQGMQKYEDRKQKLWDVYSLYGHMSLIKATVSDLRESASRRRAMATTLMSRADFEIALADRMGTSDKTVGKFFKLSDVVKLAEKHNAV